MTDHSWTRCPDLFPESPDGAMIDMDYVRSTLARRAAAGDFADNLPDSEIDYECCQAPAAIGEAGGNVQ